MQMKDLIQKSEVKDSVGNECQVINSQIYYVTSVSTPHTIKFDPVWLSKVCLLIK